MLSSWSPNSKLKKPISPYVKSDFGGGVSNSGSVRFVTKSDMNSRASLGGIAKVSD